jgi:hypothetical protein
MISKRLCIKTQREFREVADLLKKEIEDKMDKRLSKWIGKPCEFGGCMMKAENEQQYSEKKLTGCQCTDHCCPIFIKRFKGDKHGNHM